MKEIRTRSNPCASFKEVDMYGRGATFTFQRKSMIKSWIGTFFSILALALFMTWLIIRTQTLILQSDPSLSSVTISSEAGHSIDLIELGYGFAIQNIDPRIASVQVNFVEKPLNKPKKATNISMVDCNELAGKVGNLRINTEPSKPSSNPRFLCPILP